MVAAFALGKKGLKQAAQLAGDVGARTRKRLELPRSVVGSTLWRLLETQQPDGLLETLRAQAQSVLEDPNTPRLDFPLGGSLDGKSLWTPRQGEVKGWRPAPTTKRAANSGSWAHFGPCSPVRWRPPAWT